MMLLRPDGRGGEFAFGRRQPASRAEFVADENGFQRHRGLRALVAWRSPRSARR
ncbi:MAG: hypothetical protein M0C28_39665 [Candidatus Moduliflexus flocculans]|nr:hypothetical protein [Candidatus Moduliflexus flocculans]